MFDLPFLKKLQLPKLDLTFGFGSASFVGIDVGSDSVKVVQLRRERERAVLETYGELKVARYFQREGSAAGGGLLAHTDQHIVDLLTDVLRESNVTTQRAVFGIPPTASFITTVGFPLLSADELRQAVPYEAKRFIPIASAEVTLDWHVLETDESAKRTMVLIAAVPNEVVAKYRRVAELMKVELEGVEIESFSLARSLLGPHRGVTAIIQLGAVVTTLVVVDRRQVRLNNNFGRGSQEITAALAHSLGVVPERAETIKREVGLSVKPEDREVAGIISPIIDSILADVERALASYNRTAARKVENIILAGGGAGLSGLEGRVAERFGLETAVGNPFNRTVFPAFLAPVLKGIAPGFAVAVGLALRPITPV